MLFLRFIIKNLLRRPTRTWLTILGISIGVATIVVFGMVTNGLKNSMTTMVTPGTADFTVAKADVSDMILSVVTTEQLTVVSSAEGVQRVAPFVLGMTQYSTNPYFVMGGINAEDIDFFGARILSGRLYENDREVMVGRMAAKLYTLDVGDTMTVNQTDYTIVGIFESGISMQDSGATTTVNEARRITNMKENEFSLAMVKVVEGLDSRRVADSIEALDNKLIGIVDTDDYAEIDQGLVIIDSISLAISALAIIIGGIGVMNTIIMSVFERTREIGVLRAVGWRRRRILRMILGESILIGLVATVVGTLLGLGIVWLAMQTTMGKSWLSISFDVQVFVQALLVSLGVVIIGAAYPAYRATRFSPLEALRYE